MSLQQELAEVILEIGVLQLKKAKIEKLILDTSEDFFIRFQTWYNSDDEMHHDFIPNREQFPLLIEKWEKNDERRRGQTYTIEDIIGEDDLACFLEPEEMKKHFTDSKMHDQFEKTIKKVQPILEEVMAGELKSFKADW
jgi:hypothetical protein